MVPISDDCRRGDEGATMKVTTAIVGAAALFIGATPALARQDMPAAVDGPMRQVFASPGAVGYMIAPTQDGTLTRTWTWLFLKDAIPNGADTLTMEWEIDCAARTSRAVHTALYTGPAHIKTDPGPAERTAPAAGTPAAIIMTAACAAARARTTPLADAATARAAAQRMFAAAAAR